MKKALTIQKIEISKDAIIVIEGEEYHFALNYFTANPLKEGEEIEEEDFQEYCKKEVYFNCGLELTKALKRKDLTVKEAESYLLNKGYDEGIVNDVLLDYQKKGLLDDERYIKDYLINRVRKSIGLYRCIYELEQKGFKASDVAPFLTQQLRNEEERRALALARKTYAIKKEYPKVYYKLSYAGYDEDIIKKAMREIGYEMQED